MKLTKKSKKEIYELVKGGTPKGTIAIHYATSIAQVSKIEREFEGTPEEEDFEIPGLGESVKPVPPINSKIHVDEPTEKTKTSTHVDDPGEKSVSEVVVTEEPSPVQGVFDKLKEPSASASGAPLCSRCGKPLSKPSSMSAGMGDICQSHAGTISSKGFEHYREYKASLTVDEQPDSEEWMYINEAIQELKDLHGIPTGRFMNAFGGDRMLGEPIDPIFVVVWFKGRRYVKREVTTNEKYISLIKDSYEVRRQLEADG